MKLLDTDICFIEKVEGYTHNVEGVTYVRLNLGIIWSELKLDSYIPDGRRVELVVQSRIRPEDRVAVPVNILGAVNGHLIQGSMDHDFGPGYIVERQTGKVNLLYGEPHFYMTMGTKRFEVPIRLDVPIGSTIDALILTRVREEDRIAVPTRVLGIASDAITSRRGVMDLPRLVHAGGREVVYR